MKDTEKAGAAANLDLLKQKGAINWVKASQPASSPRQPPAQAGGPTADQGGGVRSGSQESGHGLARDCQRTPVPTQFEVS